MKHVRLTVVSAYVGLLIGGMSGKMSGGNVRIPNLRTFDTSSQPLYLFPQTFED